MTLRRPLKSSTIPLGSLTPSQTAELRGLLAESNLRSIIEGLAILSSDESKRRLTNNDRAGSLEYRRASGVLWKALPEMPEVS